MNRSIIAVALCIILSSCSEHPKESEQKVSTSSGSATDVVLSFIKAMSQEDSATVINSLTVEAKARILPMISQAGGFNMVFQATKGMHYDIKILNIDSATPGIAKVYVRQNMDQDSSSAGIHLRMDSLYYTVRKEEGAWKLTSLSARKP
jgi:hypothetical protein